MELKLPDNWKLESIKDAAARSKNAIVGGPFGSDLVSTDYVDRGVPVIRGQNMSDRLISGEFAYVTNAKASTLSANLARPGDLMFTQRGTLGQVSIVPDAPYERYLVSQSQMKVTLDGSRHVAAYVYQYFVSNAGQKQIELSAIQTGVPHTNLGILKRYSFPAPLLSEQTAIAEALGDVDALLSDLNKLIAKKRNLKQAAMQQLLTGKTRLPGFDGEWEVKRLGDHLKFLRNGTNSRADLNVDDGVKYLHYGDIHASRDAVWTVSGREMPYLQKVKAEGLARLQNGDVVFADASEDLAGVGKSVEICSVAGDQVVSGLHTIAVRFNKLVLADGFKAYLQFIPSFRNHLLRLVAGTKVYSTNRAHIANCELALPSVKEQVAIAQVLSDMNTDLASLEARREKNRLLKQGMMQELLTGKTRLV